MKKLNLSSSIINSSHNLLSDKLISQHKTDCLFSRIPHYTYDDLQKGIICSECHSFLSRYKEMNLICETCGNVKDCEVAVLRSVEEFKLLFPGRKITTNGVYEWCGGIKSNKAIRRILMKYFSSSGHANNSHFITK